MTDTTLIQRLSDYLSGGGLFNPELANHEAVRDLLIDCRDALEQQAAQIAEKDAEIARLTECLSKANANHEHFERAWYLRGDVNEALRADAERLWIALQEADTIMGHDDAETEWRDKWASLWPDAALRQEQPT